MGKKRDKRLNKKADSLLTELRQEFHQMLEQAEYVQQASLFDLCVELPKLGVKETYREGFRNLISRGMLSTDQITMHWIQNAKGTILASDRYFLQGAAMRFWKMWAPDIEEAKAA